MTKPDAQLLDKIHAVTKAFVDNPVPPFEELPAQDQQTIARIAEAKERRDMVPVPATNSAASVLQVIERMANNPRASVDKMQALLEMHERLANMQAVTEFNQAMARLQAVLPIITKKGRIKFVDKNAEERNTPYARFEDIEKAIRPLYIAEGFSTSYDTENAADGKIIVILAIAHVAGHKREYRTPAMMHDSSGSKNALQALGSTISYGKRYALTNGFGIVTEGQDDDGGKSSLIDEKDPIQEKMRQQANPPTVPERAASLLAALKRAKTKAKREAILGKNLALLKDMGKAGLHDQVKEIHETVAAGAIDG